MLKLKMIATRFSYLKDYVFFGLKSQHRFISALYITGDKAKENYVSLRPYMNFEEVLKDTSLLETNIAQRHMQINVPMVLVKYNKYIKERNRIQELEHERDRIAHTMKELLKTKSSDSELDTLKEQGKHLKGELKKLKEQFYAVENDFIQEFLELPNKLHPNCPREKHDKLIYRNNVMNISNSDCHLKRSDLIKFMDNSRYYLKNEASEFDVSCTYALTDYFVQNAGFTQTANPDFVRRVLLEANATRIADYHMVIEEQNKLNSAFLTGGASFESFLGAIAKLCVYPSVLPLRFVSNGRLYTKVTETADVKTNNLFTATQSNAVQTFAAASTETEAEQILDEILNLVVNFYKEIGINFQITYSRAEKLTSSESLRAEIEVYSPAQKRFICVGHVSNYGDYVSKRLLFSMRDKKDYNFLHLVGGPVLLTSRLIGALIEYQIPLQDVKLLGAGDNQKTSSAINEFKNLFS